MADMSVETSRIRDVVRDSKIRSDISSMLNQSSDSFLLGSFQGLAEQRHHRTRDVHRVGRDFTRVSADEVVRKVLRCNLREENKRLDFDSMFDEGESWDHGWNGNEDQFYDGYGDSDSLIVRFKRNLPDFDGFWHMEDLLTWIDAIDDFFEEVSPPEHVKCKIVLYKMKGAAYYWWRRLQADRNEIGKDEIISWPMMKNLLLKRFSPAKCSTKRQNQRVEEGMEVVKDLKADKFMPINCSTEFLFEPDNEKPKGASDLKILEASEVLCNDIGVETLKKATQIATNESECEGPPSETQHVGHLVIQGTLESDFGNLTPLHQQHLNLIVASDTSRAEEFIEHQDSKDDIDTIVAATTTTVNDVANTLEKSVLQSNIITASDSKKPISAQLPCNPFVLLESDYDEWVINKTCGKRLKNFETLYPCLYSDFESMTGDTLILNFDPGGKGKQEPNVSDGKRLSIVVNKKGHSPMSNHINIIGYWENIFAHDVKTPAKVGATLKGDKGYNIDYEMIHLAGEGELLASDIDAILFCTVANVILMPKAPAPLSNEDLPEFIYEVLSLYAPALQPLNLGLFIHVILSFDPGGITYSLANWNSVHCFRCNICILFASYMMAGLKINSTCGEWKIELNVIDRQGKSEFMLAYFVTEIQANTWKSVMGCVLLFNADGGTYSLKSWSSWMCFLSKSHRFLSTNIAVGRNCSPKLLYLLAMVMFQLLYTYLTQDGGETFPSHGSKGGNCEGRRIAIVQHLKSLWNVCFVPITVVNQYQIGKNNSYSEVDLRSRKKMHMVFNGLGLIMVELLSCFLPAHFILDLLLMHGMRNISGGSKLNKEGSASCEDYTVSIFEMMVASNEGCVQFLLHLSTTFVISAFCELELLISRETWGALHTDTRPNLTRWRVISWKEWNDENNYNTFVITRRSVVTISLGLSILGENGKFQKTSKLFHKIVNGLDPPMNLNDTCWNCGIDMPAKNFKVADLTLYHGPDDAPTKEEPLEDEFVILGSDGADVVSTT